MLQPPARFFCTIRCALNSSDYSQSNANIHSKKSKVVNEYVERIHDLIDIRIVPPDRSRFGMVPVRADLAAESGIAMIGCDAGTDFSNADALKAIGAEIYKNNGINVLNDVIDHVCAKMALRLIEVAAKEKIVPPNSSIGFTGRAAISGKKPSIIMDGISEMGLYDKPYEHVVFVDDGLARGAALMGRCMCSMGKPNNPIGGVRGGKCIMARRVKIGK